MCFYSMTFSVLLCTQALKQSLVGKDVNALDLSGDMAVLHYLVKGKYRHKLDLILTLLVFTEANIDLTTSKGKTPFHLAVEVCIIP